jgi:hypothetical protein
MILNASRIQSNPATSQRSELPISRLKKCTPIESPPFDKMQRYVVFATLGCEQFLGIKNVALRL